MRRLLIFLACIAACGTDGQGGKPPAKATGSLEQAFAESAQRAGVPRDLLVAIASVEEGFMLPRDRTGRLDVDNEVPAAGPLQLRHGRRNTLARGADLMQTTELDLRQNADRALDAAALVLAEIGRETGARADDLASWSDAVGELGGFGDENTRDRYVHAVYRALARGGTYPARDGETVTLAAHAIPASLTFEIAPLLAPQAIPQEPGMQVFPTVCGNGVKCEPRNPAIDIDMILIHDTEGNWQASVATLQNDPGKSVQYIIGVDGALGQFIDENTTGYHAGNKHYNHRSIGIEHVGFRDQPFPEVMYAVSARLVDGIANRWGIPRDREHVIGHDQVPNGSRFGGDQTVPPCPDSPEECADDLRYGGANHHTDPGVWEWSTYMPRFGGRAKCNDAPGAWRCSSNTTNNLPAFAFRCADGVNVEVRSCPADQACNPSDAPDRAYCAGGAIGVVPTPIPPSSNDPSGKRDGGTNGQVNLIGARVPVEGCAAGGAPAGDAGLGTVWLSAGLALLGLGRARHRQGRLARDSGERKHGPGERATQR